MGIFHSLDSRLITFLDVTTRDEAIDCLIDLLVKQGKLSNKELFREALFQREKLISTGIGMGVAVPHAKLRCFSEFFIVLGLQKKVGIDWNALDKGLVQIIFMIGGPDDRQSEYLQMLSQLTSAIKNANLRKSLLKAQSSEQVISALQTF